MLFNSWQFALFFPIVFALYWGLPHRFRIGLILTASYYFYMSWNVKYVVLILFTTIVSYFAALLISKTDSTRTKKAILILSLIACLGVLFVFKYFNFFAGAVVDFMSLFTIHLHPMTLKLLLPVGISFYTFQTLGYVIDVYRGTTQPERNFWVYAAFISFFPQLVAGPIERTNNLLPQIKAAHEFNYQQAVYGIKLMTWGFFKKLAVADVLAVYVDRAFFDVYSYQGFSLLLAVFFFTVQIYCDFSGYSDIARGCSKMLGIELMENFRSPYFASSLREFWSRWHISLSTWFRDYVYIPLGGNRCGKFRHNMNLLVTFMISGLWHGASWTFVVWGMLHGLGQVLENAFTPKSKHEPHELTRLVRTLVTFVFVMLAWVFFRAQSLSEAVYVFGHMFTVKSGIRKLDININKLVLFLVLTCVLFVHDYISFKHDAIDMISSQNIIIRWLVYNALIVLTFFTYVTLAVTNASFVYFQF